MFSLHKLYSVFGILLDYKDFIWKIIRGLRTCYIYLIPEEESVKESIFLCYYLRIIHDDFHKKRTWFAARNGSICGDRAYYRVTVLGDPVAYDTSNLRTIDAKLRDKSVINHQILRRLLPSYYVSMVYCHNVPAYCSRRDSRARVPFVQCARNWSVERFLSAVRYVCGGRVAE